MPARVAVRPPNRPSNSARTVRHMFGNDARLVRNPVLPRQYHHLINWGNSSPVRKGEHVKIYNPPPAISRAANKLLAFEALHRGDVSIPEFQTEAPTVRPGEIWLARSHLSASGGFGISVLRHDGEVPRVPLYVKYIPKRREFRVHVVNDEAIFVQEKLRRNDTEQTRDQRLIRNYDNGWVFAINSINDADREALVPLLTEAKKAVNVLGLTFGAVDCLLRKSDSKPFILEINTAPGVQSPTLTEAYSTAFRRLIYGRAGE